jgi:Transmembrane secretion effector
MLPLALRHPLFVRYFVAFSVSAIGTWVQAFVQSWVIYESSGHNPAFLGWLSLALAGPMIVLTPFGGSVVDRLNKRDVLVCTQLLQAACATGVGLLAVSGELMPVHILCAQTIAASLLAVDNPARQSLLPELVSKSSLPSALSLSSAIFTGAALIGPAIGSALYTRIPVAALFFLNAGSFMVPLICVLTIPRKLGAATPRATSDRAGEALRFIWQAPHLRMTLGTAIAVALFGRSYTQLLAAYARESLRQQASGFGSLLTCGGFGALVGAALMTWRAQTAKVMDAQALGGRVRTLVCIFAVLLIALSRVQNPTLACVLVAALGCNATVFTTTTATALQREAPPQLRGRIMALHVVTVIGLPYLGALALATLARIAGTAHAFLTAGGLCAAFALLMRF